MVSPQSMLEAGKGSQWHSHNQTLAASREKLPAIAEPATREFCSIRECRFSGDETVEDCKARLGRIVTYQIWCYGNRSVNGNDK
jgi:hypothetical protein